MADYNRNRQDAYRQQNDWDDDYGRRSNSYEDGPNYTISENRGYRDGGRQGSMSSGDGGWQSRYERQMNTGREGDYDRGATHNRYGSHSARDYGYGTGHRGLSSAYSDFGGDYSGSDYSRGGSRNLYDRGDQGMGRRDYQNSENRLGGANYDRYGDRDRYSQGHSFGGGHGGSSRGWERSDFGRSDYGRHDDRNDYGRSNYGRGNYRDSDYGRGETEERSWWDRTTDEVSSWFGDEDAERRRERDRNHRGKGPRSYTRSDTRIQEDINDRLSDDPFIDASDIDVTVNNGEVVLSGSVDHRSMKRRAEDLSDAVSGVKNVENRIRVGQLTGSQSSGVSGMNNPSGATGTSSSPIPGSERGRTRESSKTT